MPTLELVQPETEAEAALEPSDALPLTPIRHHQHYLALIDNGHDSQGVLLIEQARNQMRKILLEQASFVRQTHHLRLYDFPELFVTAQQGVYVCATPENELLPFPSLLPYRFCELDEQKFLRLHRLFHEPSDIRQGIESALEIIAKQTHSPLRNGKLTTPKGYADLEKMWMSYSLKFSC